MLPTLTGLAGDFHHDDQRRQAEEHGGIPRHGAEGAVRRRTAVVEAFKTVGTTLGGVFAAIGAAISGDFAGAKKILGELKTDIGSSSWIKTLDQ